MVETWLWARGRPLNETGDQHETHLIDYLVSKCSQLSHEFVLVDLPFLLNAPAVEMLVLLWSIVSSSRYKQLDMDWTPCVVHALQLVVLMVKEEAAVKRILNKTRHLAELFRKSSVATQKVVETCDCPTRWSSTFNMIARLLIIKVELCDVATDMGWDT